MKKTEIVFVGSELAEKKKEERMKEEEKKKDEDNDKDKGGPEGKGGDGKVSHPKSPHCGDSNRAAADCFNKAYAAEYPSGHLCRDTTTTGGAKKDHAKAFLAFVSATAGPPGTGQERTSGNSPSRAAEPPETAR